MATEKWYDPSLAPLIKRLRAGMDVSLGDGLTKAYIEYCGTRGTTELDSPVLIYRGRAWVWDAQKASLVPRTTVQFDLEA